MSEGQRVNRAKTKPDRPGASGATERAGAASARAPAPSAEWAAAQLGSAFPLGVQRKVQIGPSGDAGLDGGSRLTGTIDEVVYLGMYTQFHVDTHAGRIVCHRLADESLASFGPGTRVTLSWQAEQASILSDAVSP